MRRNYRETKDELVHCPFNKNHLVKRCRLITHKKNCPDKSSKGIIQCPYNPSHNVTIENLEKHKSKCPDKVIISPELEKEMEDFIKNGSINNKAIIEEKENIQNNQNEIGVLEPSAKSENDPKKIKKKNKKSKKETNFDKLGEKSINLESMTNKELFNFIFNDNMVIEYHSDSSENNDDEIEPEIQAM